MPKSNDGEMQVKFYGAATRGNCVPVDILSTSLASLQKVIHFLAFRHEGAEEASGASVPAVIRQRYSLVCRLPESGSYTVPVTIGETPHAPGSDVPPDVLADLQRLFRAVQNHDELELEEMFPAARIRAGVTRALCNLVPKPLSGTQIAVQSRSGRDLFVPDAGTGRFLKSPTGSRTGNDIERSVAGHLTEIDFDHHRIRLQHPPTGRELSCLYPSQLEAMLVGWRRDLIQVVGEVTIGPEDVPQRIRSVDNIHLVDLSPIELTEFVTRGRRVRARRPIAFEPAMDDAYQHFMFREAPFGIHLLSVTREELETNLHEEMDVLWRHYACADDAMLTPDARELKQQLHGAFHTA